MNGNIDAPLRHCQNPSQALLAAVLATSAWMLLAGPETEARAESVVGYTLRISIDERLLDAPTSKEAMRMASWRTRHDFLLLRDRPLLELVNTSNTARIERFTLSIGDIGKNFDFVEFLGSSPGVTPQLDSSLPSLADAVEGGQRGDMLAVDFSDSFGPSQSFRARVDIDSDLDLESKLQEFRTVLFHPEAGSDTSRNAVVKVTFSDGTVLEDPIPNFHPAAPLDTVGVRSSYTRMKDMADLFQTGVAVPEPSGLALLIVGALGTGLAAVYSLAQRAA